MVTPLFFFSLLLASLMALGWHLATTRAPQATGPAGSYLF